MTTPEFSDMLVVGLAAVMALAIAYGKRLGGMENITARLH